MNDNLTNENLTEIAEKVTKQKRPKKSEQMSVHTEPGDNAKYLAHALKMASLPKIDYKDAKQVEARIFEYFVACEEADMKPSVAGMAVAIGVDRKTVWEWRTAEKSDRSNAIKRACAILDTMMNDYMQNGKINPASGIFLMKNNFDYADKQEVVLTPNNPLGEQKSNAELEQKYLDSIADEKFDRKI